MSEHKIPIPSMLYNAAVGGHVTNSQQIIDEDYNLEQKEINKEILGVPYNASNPNGMGKIVLKKNDNFKQVVEAQTSGNTIFVIKYDFTLTGDVTVPANCVLEFDGGSISGAYTLTGNNTSIKANEKDVIFTGVIFDGSWVVKDIYATWFSDVEQTNRLKQVFNLSSDNIHNNIFFSSSLNCSVATFSGEEDMVGIINIKSYTDFYFDGIITLETSNVWGYDIVMAKDKHNINIIGSGTIIGDKDTHIYTTEYPTNEWCYGLALYSCTNVIVNGLTIKKCVGDGINCYNTTDNKDCFNNYIIKNCTISDCRRNGISIEAADTIILDNLYIYDISGTSPQVGVDIEPDLPNSIAKNIIIKNCKIGSTSGNSIHFYGNESANIKIENVKLDNIELPSNPRIEIIGVTNIDISNIRSQFGVTSSTNITFNNIVGNAFINVNCKNVRMINSILNRVGLLNNCFVDKCILLNSYSLTYTNTLNNCIVNNCILLGGGRGDFKNVIIQNCLIYKIIDSGYTYILDLGINSKNVTFRNNKWYNIGKGNSYLICTRSDRVEGTLVKVKDVKMINDAVYYDGNVSIYTVYNDIEFYNVLYTNHLFMNSDLEQYTVDENIHASNINIGALSEALSLPQYLQDIKTKYPIY